MNNPFVANALQQVGLAPAVEAHIDAALNDILADSTPIADEDKCPSCRGTGKKSFKEWTDEQLEHIYPERPSDEEMKKMVRERLEDEDRKAADYIAQLKKELGVD